MSVRAVSSSLSPTSFESKPVIKQAPQEERKDQDKENVGPSNLNRTDLLGEIRMLTRVSKNRSKYEDVTALEAQISALKALYNSFVRV